MIVNVRKLHQTDSSSRITGGRGSLNTLIAPVVVRALTTRRLSPAGQSERTERTYPRQNNLDGGGAILTGFPAREKSAMYPRRSWLGMRTVARLTVPAEGRAPVNSMSITNVADFSGAEILP